MFRVVMFFVFMFAVSAAPDHPKRKCHRLHHNMMRCCIGISTSKITRSDDLKECFEKTKPRPPPPFSCDFEDCIAKKNGYYAEDGKLDKEALASFIEKQYENNKEVVTAMKEKCLDGDISKYGPPGMCDIMKMRHCFDNQFVKNCPEWSNEDECNGIQDLVTDCVHDD